MEADVVGQCSDDQSARLDLLQHLSVVFILDRYITVNEMVGAELVAIKHQRTFPLVVVTEGGGE